MKKTRLYIPVLILLLLCGCATGPSPLPPGEEASSPRPTPSSTPPLPPPPPTRIPSPPPSPTPTPTPALVMELLFYSDLDGEGEIYTLDLSTGERRQLTDNQAFDGFPSWSPDRTKILFVSERDGNREIYIMEADGDDPIRVTDNSVPDGYPCWAPSGDQIAFFSGREAADTLCLLDLGTRESRLLTDFEDGNGGTMVFSPAGEKIIFGYERHGKYKNYIVDITGGGARELINHACADSRISWTPDGAAIFYVSGKGNQKDIWMLFVEDGRFKHITKNTADDFSPCLSPEGDELVFCSRRDGERWQIYLVSLEGEPLNNPVRRLTNDSFNYCYPDWK